jgi:hypothetical protein
LDAYESLIEHREERAKTKVRGLDMGQTKHRAAISSAKQPFLDGIISVLNENRNYWPLSDRQIHYRLLNAPPLRHAGKPGSAYQNDMASYKSLVDLLTRARLEGQVPMDAISDETRPVAIWTVWPDVTGFVRSELNGVLKNYWRDLMRSQPCHVELLVEKNTVAGLVKDVAMSFCIPVTSGRGFCSLPPRNDMAKRFRASGKEKLIVLIISDFDPDGEEIAASFARSMRDDFGIASLCPHKVALTNEQVRRFKLAPQMLAKEGSTNYEKFVTKFGRNVYELEALPPDRLQELVKRAIDSVIDRDAFNAELDRERQDAAQLEGLRLTLTETLKGFAGHVQ